MWVGGLPSDDLSQAEAGLEALFFVSLVGHHPMACYWTDGGVESGWMIRYLV